MELTNFIWHLGAALAALWAGLAYRSTKMKLIELEQGVLASLFENLDGDSKRPTPVQIRRRVSIRARTLRWFSAELARSQRIQVEFPNRQALFELMQRDWSLAVSRLSSLLNDKAFFKKCSGRKCKLIWFSDGTTGNWVLES